MKVSPWRTASAARYAIAVLTVALLAGVAACSSSSSSSGGAAAGDQPSGSAQSASNSSGDAALAAAKAFVAANLKPAGPPTPLQTPFTPVKDKYIGIASADQEVTETAAVVSGIQSAAELLGWKVVVADGQGTPVGENTAMQLLVRDHVDGILTVSLPDQAIPQALTAAHNAHIPVISVGSGTKLNKPVANPSVLTVDFNYVQMGQMLGSYLVASSNGTARVAFLTYDAIPALAAIDNAAIAVVKACTGCQVVATQDIGNATNMTATAASLTEAILSQHPGNSVTYIAPANDGMTPGITQAIQAAKRSILIASTGCQTDSVGFGQVLSGTGPTVLCNWTNATASGWGAFDQMARLLSGVKTESVDLGASFVTHSNSKQYNDFNYVAYYKKLWGIQ